MRIFITCPSFAPHGGIRVILEWANRLAARSHLVFLRTDDTRGCNWFEIDRRVMVVHADDPLRRSDCLIVCSPHAADYLYRSAREAPVRRFAFMQMVEHLFRPGDRAWYKKCLAFYRTPFPMFLISKWNEAEVRRLGREGECHYIGNGVNLDHFPVTHPHKDGRTVLIEGWVPGNPSKDIDRVAPQVAARLRAEGYIILTYSQQRPGRDAYYSIPHEYRVRPSLAEMNNLYERATVLVKATKFDARSCSPMEAMTKGTVTARAIEKGDDDLIHDENCLRVKYSVPELYAATKRLLKDQGLRDRLAANCRAHVQKYTWDYWMDEVEGILWVKS